MKFIAHIFFTVTILLAEEAVDSTKMHQVNEVVVTSTRFVQNQNISPLHYTLVDREAMQSSNSNSLADVLQSTGGISIKHYAGNSGIKIISQRGMGSEHTVILLNGMRMSIAQNSLVDLGLYNLESFDAVELISGGSSSLYGADAVAGAVNIITRTSKEKNSVSAKYSIGSFGDHKYSASIGNSFDDIGFRIGLVRETSDEDYSFTVAIGPNNISSKRHNADFDLTNLFLMSDGFISDRISFSVYSAWLQSERGVPGLFVSSTSSSIARQQDEDGIFTCGMSYALTDSITLNTQLLARYFYERYHDPAIVVGNMPVDNFFVNIDARLNSSIVFREKNGLWNFGGEFAQIRARGNSLKNNVQRDVASAFLSYERTLPVQSIFLEKVILLPSARLDAISQFPTIVSPAFAISIVLPSVDLVALTNFSTVFRASVSKNYSAPTFNQLYYNGGGGIGNPHIQPEKGISEDIGVSIYFDFLGKNELGAKYFFIHLKNRIVWISAGSNSVTPKNVRDTESKGVELNYHFSLFNNFAKFEIGYSTISVVKIKEDYPGDPNVGKYLIYVPTETFTSSFGINAPLHFGILSLLSVHCGYQRTGYRYITEDNTRFLPSVNLINLNLNAEFLYEALKPFCKFEINNITDQQYQIIYSYPMPGRSFRFTAGIQF